MGWRCVGLGRGVAILIAAAIALCAQSSLLQPEDFRHHVEFLNRYDAEDGNGGIPNREAWEWMKANVPFFACPDSQVELTYYYRWWAYRKHIETTPRGFVITEFLKPVKHATEFNAISCALGLQINEGRWLRDRRYLDDYVKFWLHGGEDGGLQPHYHQFSNWTADALYDRWLADGEAKSLLAELPALLADCAAWDRERLTPSGLDGMESSISGGRREKNLRPTINSYMYGNARALAAIAGLAGDAKLRAEYREKAAKLKKLVEGRLWDADAQFFETVKEAGGFANVREEAGYTPWYFDLPEPGKGYESAWKQLMDPAGFHAPFGPTTAERRHPEFLSEQHDDCQWNGFTWPFATSITLRALANLLNDNIQAVISKADYFQTFLQYARSQQRKLDNGESIPWVDEDMNPLTGEWWARALKMKKPGFYGRGDHYNHSSFADLVITGVVGLRPQAGNRVEVNPLVPEGSWDWFALDRVPYHGHLLSIAWDRDGRHFGRGKGLRLYVDGKEIAQSATLGKIEGQ